MAKASTASNVLASTGHTQLSLLLSISQAIATIRERRQLFATIFEQISPFIPIDDTAIVVFDRTGERWQDWTNADNYHYHPAASQLSVLGYDHFIPMDRFARYTSQNSGIMAVAQFREQYPEHPFGPTMWEAGLREMLFTPLVYQGKTVGVLFLDSEQEDTYSQEQLSLVKSLANMIAVAVVNILANEEILEREREKTLLLSLSGDMANIRNRDDLWRVMMEKIKPLVGFEDAVLLTLNKEQTEYNFLLTMSPMERQTHFLYQTVTGKNQVAKGPVEWFLNHPDDCILQDLKELEENATFPSLDASVVLMKETGLWFSIVYKLRWRDDFLGLLLFHYANRLSVRTEIFNLYHSIIDQVTVALANILANEEIQRLNEQLQEQNAYLIEEVEQQYNLGEMVGQSPALQNLHHNLRLVAPTNTTVLIMGESGTGKELVARALHQASPRRAKPLVKINCAALPPNLIESELFGHEKGAFTGATDRRIGKFELAHGSTLFLDEIGELPLDLQAKLLRAIQEKEIERVGSNKVIPTDVRIISATNRHLVAEVQAGRFRADLYYRLSVFPLSLPPLRERPDDLPLLVAYFMQKLARRLGKPLQSVSGRAMRQLLAYDWPGNIRELENVLERAAILCPGKVIQELYLPVTRSGSTGTGGSLTALPEEPALQTAAENERDHILRVLRHCKGKVSGRGGAAELLQMKPSTLEFHMKKLGILREHVRGD